METINVLVIDDDPNIRKLLEELLAGKPNYNLMVVGDGKSAARCFAEQRVDVVLTDIHMPGFTGIELMADMKKLKFQPEILVMTANATPENVEKARAIGARSLVLKPFDNLEVVEEEIEKAVAAARESAAAAGGTPQTQGIEAAPSGEPQPEQPAPAPPAPPTPVPPQAAPAGAGGSTVKVERPEIDAWKSQLVGNETPAPAPAPAVNKAGGG
ncbi:MAG: response regulator, partial [Acidobacteria bacterium]|nr:response regulator [Acidobacteriota bacterium]